MQKLQSLWNSIQLKSRDWRDFQYGKYMYLMIFEFMRIFRISSKSQGKHSRKIMKKIFV